MKPEDLYRALDTCGFLDYCAELAAKRGISETAAVLRVANDGVSRRKQLDEYAAKKKDKDAKFRAYAPIKASDTARVELKRRAQAEGVSEGIAPLCGNEAFINGQRRKCWLAPHGEGVAHKY
jgi:hypothetical protein